MDLEPLMDAARRMADAVRALPRGSRFFLHCDTDADGIASAAVAATALQWAGHRYQVRASRDKTAQAYTGLFKQDADGYMVLDKGTSHLGDLAAGAAAVGKPVFVIDHHSLVEQVPDGVHLLNPRVLGLDGSRDACSSTSALAFAVAMHGDAAWALSGPALVGAIGDWQHMHGWHGFNRRAVDEGLAHGTLEKVMEPRYIGVDLVDAITRWGEPDLPGLTGDRDAVEAFLQRIQVQSAGDVEALAPHHKTRLITGIVLHGLAHGVAPEELSKVVHATLYSRRIDAGVRHAFRLVDACAREGDIASGLAFLLGDPDAHQEAERHFKAYRATLETNLSRLREEGTRMLRACQYMAIERPAYTGMVGGLGMTHVAPDKSRPMVVSAPRRDGDLQVSTRGNEAMVSAGLDLGAACRGAGAAVGREGGGHPIAAGVVIGADDLESFLAALDEVLVSQAFMEAA